MSIEINNITLNCHYKEERTDTMKLIISEKPSTARIIAHAVGARELIEGSGKVKCYKGSGYYVANARGHIYGIGEPADYGFSKTWQDEELPMFPQFRVIANGEEGAEDIRKTLSALINKEDVEYIICATDAGREGELIFRHIYEANSCTKPVKRLWCNSMTDEAITKLMENLPDASEFDGLYKAGLAREQCDWMLGMNLSRLYGIKDHLAHRVGRVKTPLLALIVEKDAEIANFVKKTTYKIQLPDGALSETAYDEKETAEDVISSLNGKDLKVVGADSTEKKINRPLLFSLSALQQEANNIYGYTAMQTLDAAQELYEKKLLTYPRTDCNYISEDMKNKVIAVLDKIGDRDEYADRVRKLREQGYVLDSRMINNKAMEDHDHHAIIPELTDPSNITLPDIERNIYALVVDRLLCCADKQYVYSETVYTYDCEGNIFTLKCTKPIEIGWKEYAKEKKAEQIPDPGYAKGRVLVFENAALKECVSQPPKHYTDSSILSVMNNIDNRIEDNELKMAVKGKGIGTEATRAGFIEELIAAGYIKREGKMLLATKFGSDFIASLPDNVKSVERTAEWEQELENIRSGKDPQLFVDEVKRFIRSVIDFERSPERVRETVVNENAPKRERESIGTCPVCGKNVYEGKMNFYCESGKDCRFTLWKQPRGFKSEITPDRAKKLLNNETVELKAVSKEGKEYTADFKIEDDGKYINLRYVKKEKQIIGACPLCGKNVYEGAKNYYCESGRECRFNFWKESKYYSLTVSPANMAALLKGKTFSKKSKNISGEIIERTFQMVDTGEYFNLEEVKK